MFEQNLEPRLSIDETSLSHGELYTVVTNKEAKGKKGTLVAIIEGTKSENIIPFLQKLSLRKRNKVEEITLDLAGNMGLIAKKCFPNAVQVIDRFHVQQLATEALQEIRIKHRWDAIEGENQAIENARKESNTYTPQILENGDTLKQLLARSRYLLYKTSKTGLLSSNSVEQYCLIATLTYKRHMKWLRNYHGYFITQERRYTA